MSKKMTEKMTDGITSLMFGAKYTQDMKIVQMPE